MHNGLDFAAHRAMWEYATVHDMSKERSSDSGGLGSQFVTDDHEYRYRAPLAYLSPFIVKRGWHEQHSEVTGYAGDTGKCVRLDCQYEVLLRMIEINPVYFFYNELTPGQYDQILKTILPEAQKVYFDGQHSDIS